MTFKLALITGATSGIGEGLARLLHQKKISLILTGRNREKLEQLKKELGCETVAIDLEGDRSELVALIKKRAPDLVINNAGFGLYGEALSFSTEEQMKILEVNAMALLELTLEGARAMISEGKAGVIMNISSASAYQPFPTFSVYGASKAFVNSVSQSLDFEFKNHGVRVLAACPGMVSTNFSKRASNSEKVRDEPGVMKLDFAVQEIWMQIEKLRPIHIFDWRYRLMIGFGRLFPGSISGKYLGDLLSKRYKKRPLILNEKTD
jgi:short-subunit dehydrogenase